MLGHLCKTINTNYYKKLNDASYQSQFEARNCGGESNRRHHGKDSSRKKKKSGNVSRERTNSDSGMNLYYIDLKIYI